VVGEIEKNEFLQRLVFSSVLNFVPELTPGVGTQYFLVFFSHFLVLKIVADFGVFNSRENSSKI